MFTSCLNSLRVLVPSAALFACVNSASAALITLEPDTFGAGANLTNAVPGVTLTALGQSSNSNVFASVGNASTGSLVFYNADDGEEWGNGFNSGLRFDFLFPTDFVAIDIIANDGFDQGRLLAYDSGNNLLATYTTAGLSGAGKFESASIARASADIAYVIATGDAANNESVSLDNFRFNGPSSVPDSGTTIALLGASFCAIAAMRRKRV